MRKFAVPLVLLALMSAGVAVADTYYRYETETAVAFTDDPERIPMRYRDSVRMLEAKSLFDYGRTTIIEPRRDVAAAPPRALLEPPRRAADAQSPTVSLEVAPGIFMQVPVGGEDPVKVTKGWVQKDGTLRPYLKVGQGDKVLLEMREDVP